MADQVQDRDHAPQPAPVAAPPQTLAEAVEGETLAEVMPIVSGETLAEPDAPPAVETLGEAVSQVDAPKAEATAPPVPEAREAATLSEPENWQVGDVIEERYEVRGVLGRGGMGTVYHVYDNVQALDLAMKTPVFRGDAPTRQHLEDRFINEALAWIGLGMHLHIVACCYVRRAAGRLRLFLEYVPGQSLQARLDEARKRGETLPLREVLDIGIQLCWALEYVHKQGIIHRDIKPDNILLVEAGEILLVKLTDFGIIKAAETPEIEVAGTGVQLGAAELTRFTGGFIGTPAYAAPEQFLAPEKVGPASDVYAMGVVLYELLTGRWPVGEEHRQADARALASLFRRSHAQATTPDKDIALPEAIQEVLWRCLAREAGARYPDAAALAEELAVAYTQAVGQDYPRKKPPEIEALADGLNNQAFSLVELERFEEAIRIWSQALYLDSSHLETIFNHGLLLWRLGRMTGLELIARLNVTRKLRPSDWRYEYLIGLVHLERGDQEKAENMLMTMSDKNYQVQQMLTDLRNNVYPSRTCLKILARYDGSGVSSVAISADGRMGLSGRWESSLLVWDVASGECLQVLSVGIDINTVAISADGQFGLVGGTYLQLWNLRDGVLLKTIVPKLHSIWDYRPRKSKIRMKPSEITAVAITTDGRWGLAGNDAGSIGILDFTALEKRVEIHDNFIGFNTQAGITRVTSVAISTNKKLALVGSVSSYYESEEEFTRYGTHYAPMGIVLFDFATRELVRAFGEPNEAVMSVAISADGRIGISGSKAKTLRIWDLETGKCLRVLKGHEDEVTSVSLSSDGQFALSGSKDKTVRLWSLMNGQCLRVFEGHAGNVTSVSMSADGQWGFSGDDSGGFWRNGDLSNLRLWNLGQEGRPISYILALPQSFDTLNQYRASFNSLLQKANNALAKYLLKEATVVVNQARQVPGYQNSPRALDLCHKLGQKGIRKHLISGWLVKTFDEHIGEVTSVSIAADGRFGLSGDACRTLCFWDLNYRQCLWSLEEVRWEDIPGDTYTLHNEIYAVCISQDGEVGLVSGMQRQESYGPSFFDLYSLRLYNFVTDKVQILGDKTWEVNSVAISADRHWGLAGGGKVYGQQSDLWLWDLATGKCLMNFGEDAVINAVAISPNSQFAVSGSRDLRLWSLVTGECLKVFEEHTKPIVNIVVSPDGQSVLSVSQDGDLRIWKLATGKCCQILKRSGVTSIAISGDSRFAISGNEDGTLQIWNLVTGKCIQILEGHTQSVISVTMSADSRFALSGSEDRTVRLWEFEWKYDYPYPADWDEGARPYLQDFLTLHTPYAGKIPQDREPTEEEITLALTRRGKPTWAEVDFEQLLYTLGCVGYGWLRPEGVRRELEKMAETCNGPPPLVAAPLTEATALPETPEIEPLTEVPILPETLGFEPSPTPQKLTVWQRLRRWWKRKTQ